MRIYLLLIISFTTYTFVTAQSVPIFQHCLYFEDAIGNRDTVTFGYDPSSTVGIDTIFSETNIIDSSYIKPLDVRISNSSFYNSMGYDSAHFCMSQPSYQSKMQIFNYDSTNGISYEIFALNIHCNYFPILLSWDNPTAFFSTGRYYSLVTNWSAEGWFDALSSPYEEMPTFLHSMSTTQFSTIPHCYINAMNDTIRLLFFAFIPQNWILNTEQHELIMDDCSIRRIIGTENFLITVNESPFDINIFDLGGRLINRISCVNDNIIVDLSKFHNSMCLINISSKDHNVVFKQLVY